MGRKGYIGTSRGLFMAEFIPAEWLSIKKLSGHVLAAQEATRREMIMYLNQTIETWVHNRPTFDKNAVKETFAGGNLEIKGQPIGDAKGVKKWHALNTGTHRRYVVMTRDFVPKTRPGRIRARTGKGGVAGIDPAGRPGIEPRRWYYTITHDAMQARYVKRIDRAISKGLAK